MDVRVGPEIFTCLFQSGLMVYEPESIADLHYHYHSHSDHKPLISTIAVSSD